MAGIMDMLFRLTPVEPEQETPPMPTAQELPTIPDSVQLGQMGQSQSQLEQVDAPEDATNNEDSGWSAEVERLNATIDALATKVDQLIKYGNQTPTVPPVEPPKMTPDAPADYVPLKELDFVTRDGKF